MKLSDYIISNPTRGIPDPLPFKPEGGPDIWFKPITTSKYPDPRPWDKGV